MASLSPSLDRPIRGIDATALDALIEALGEGAIGAQLRHEALELFNVIPAPNLQPGRYWKIDLAKLDFSDVVVQSDSRVEAQGSPWVRSLADAANDGAPDLRALFERTFRSALDLVHDKYAALALAFQSGGAFVRIPPGTTIEEPIELTYVAQSEAIFPYTLVVAGEGSRCTIVERIVPAGTNPFVCGVTEIIAEPRARVALSSIVEPGAGRVFATRRARVDAGAELAWSIADLGGDLVVDSLRQRLEERGASGEIAGLFFTDGTQHVALDTQIDHAIGETVSKTVLKGAATGRGQGRYVGNIRIHPHAHLSEASLRDDNLLLSKHAHVDSIPALEIEANDVKAFHGATIGAIDEDEIFYAQSRGISRADAERMIALGFFEPALASFHETLHASLRTALERKLLVTP